MGPIKVADSPVILIQDPDNEIYGTGHNSVLCLPDRDEWYIVYHRINRHYVSSDPGIHREVCIDRMEFNADGTIKPVTPTNRGVDPVDISSYAAGIDNVTVTPADAEVVRSLWYNTAGICLGSKQPTASGLFIRVDIMADGSSRSAKIVR